MLAPHSVSYTVSYAMAGMSHSFTCLLPVPRPCLKGERGAARADHGAGEQSEWVREPILRLSGQKSIYWELSNTPTPPTPFSVTNLYPFSGPPFLLKQYRRILFQNIIDLIRMCSFSTPAAGQRKVQVAHLDLVPSVGFFRGKAAREALARASV